MGPRMAQAFRDRPCMREILVRVVSDRPGRLVAQTAAGSIKHSIQNSIQASIQLTAQAENVGGFRYE